MNDVLKNISILLIVEDDPKAYKEAMMSRDVALRKETINNEMNSLLYNNTWIIVDLSSNSKAVRCKWVFRRKYNYMGQFKLLKQG